MCSAHTWLLTMASHKTNEIDDDKWHRQQHWISQFSKLQSYDRFLLFHSFLFPSFGVWLNQGTNWIELVEAKKSERERQGWEEERNKNCYKRKIRRQSTSDTQNCERGDGWHRANNGKSFHNLLLLWSYRKSSTVCTNDNDNNDDFDDVDRFRTSRFSRRRNITHTIAQLILSCTDKRAPPK